jgi:plastocyanin
MKTHRIAALAGAAGLALLGATIPGYAAAAPGPSPKVQVVELRDDCDPASFPVDCKGDGGTTGAELLAALRDKGSEGHWKFNPSNVKLPAGSKIQPHNVGGEAHTFTPVPAFVGAGCVKPINDALGTGPAIPCGPTIAAGFKGDPIPLANPGTYRFQCMIHPWMKTTVTVEASTSG